MEVAIATLAGCDRWTGRGLLKFEFHLASAAARNTPTAQRREACRMAAVAYGLRLVGQEVAIANKPPMDEKWWRPFASLPHTVGKPDVVVVSAEAVVRHLATRPRNTNVVIGFKTSCGIQRDREIFKAFPIVVAHEYDPALDAAPALLPVPFLVHQRVLDVWTEQGMMEHYLRDDLDYFREHYKCLKTGLLGYRGCGTAGCQHRAEFGQTAPNWCDFKLYTSHSMTAEEHVRWLIRFHGGLCLPGETPKVNLHPLLALLGLVIVAPPMPVRDTPPLDESNSIVFQDWNITRVSLEDAATRNFLIAQADDAYRTGWSPLGQAKQLLKRLNV